MNNNTSLISGKIWGYSRIGMHGIDGFHVVFRIVFVHSANTVYSEYKELGSFGTVSRLIGINGITFFWELAFCLLLFQK